MNNVYLVRLFSVSVCVCINFGRQRGVKAVIVKYMKITLSMIYFSET